MSRLFFFFFFGKRVTKEIIKALLNLRNVLMDYCRIIDCEFWPITLLEGAKKKTEKK